jgi:hypothetical protein
VGEDVKITITMEVAGEFADPGHDMGVTEDGFLGIEAALEPFSADGTIDIARQDGQP